MMRDILDARRAQVLAEHHAEEGRLHRVFGIVLGQIDGGVVSGRGNKQLPPAPGSMHGQKQLIRLGLVYLFNFSQGQFPFQFLRHGAGHNTVV